MQKFLNTVDLRPAPPTVASIIWRKCLLALEAARLSAIFSFFCRLSLALALSIAVADFERVAAAFLAFLRWHDSAPLKTAFVFAAVFGWDRLRSTVRTIFAEPPLAGFFRTKSEDARDLVCGAVELPSLVDLLVETRGFSFVEATGRLALSRNAFEKIAKMLDGAGITERGPSNARTIPPARTREEIAAAIKNACRGTVFMGRSSL